jgi:hypothetical protein
MDSITNWGASELTRHREHWCLPFYVDCFFPLSPTIFFIGGNAYPSRTHRFTPLQFFMGSVLLIFLFALDLFTNVLCVS